MSKPALYKLTYALIMVRGYFTDAGTIGCGGYSPEQNSRNTAHFRIWLYPGTEDRFTEMSGLPVSEPPKVHVNMNPPPPPVRDVDWDEFVGTRGGQLAIMTRDYRIVARNFSEWIRANGRI